MNNIRDFKINSSRDKDKINVCIHEYNFPPMTGFGRLGIMGSLISKTSIAR